MEVPKKLSMMKDVLEKVSSFEPSDCDYCDKALKAIECMKLYTESTTCALLIEQFQILLTKNMDEGIMVKRPQIIMLPDEKVIRRLLNKSLSDENLGKLFHELKPQQRLLNVIFDEVKLKQALRFSGGHITGQSSGSETLVTSALVFELACHHGGPKYALRIIPVSCLNAEQLRIFVLDVYNLVKEKGGTTISLISDNCRLDQKVYNLIGGPGLVQLDADDDPVYAVDDYDHVRYNWFTEANKELCFKIGDVEYTAYWKDIVATYEEDQKTEFRLTKLTFSSVYPKPLQRQNTKLVSQVFNDKTVAAMTTLQQKLIISDGSIKWIQIIQWYKMMSVKSKYIASRLNDEYRENGLRIVKVLCIYPKYVIRYQPVYMRELETGKENAGNAFLITTKYNVLASKKLIESHCFEYVLPAIYSQNPIEKFFGQARQRVGGNFYIDIGDVIASAKAQHLHQLLKYDIIPDCESSAVVHCVLCASTVKSTDLEVIDETSIKDTEDLFNSSDTMKEKVVYIA